jgi:hypothetical protein
VDLCFDRQGVGPWLGRAGQQYRGAGDLPLGIVDLAGSVVTAPEYGAHATMTGDVKELESPSQHLTLRHAGAALPGPAGY